MTTAIVYVREMPGVDLQAQIAACRAYAEAHNRMPVAAVIDLHLPGPGYRLGMRGVLDMVSAGDIPMVVAISPEQVSKDPVRLAAMQEMLAEKNCELHYAGMQI